MRSTYIQLFIHSLCSLFLSHAILYLAYPEYI